MQNLHLIQIKENLENRMAGETAPKLLFNYNLHNFAVKRVTEDMYLQ